MKLADTTRTSLPVVLTMQLPAYSTPAPTNAHFKRRHCAQNRIASDACSMLNTARLLKTYTVPAPTWHSSGSRSSTGWHRRFNGRLRCAWLEAAGDTTWCHAHLSTVMSLLQMLCWRCTRCCCGPVGNRNAIRNAQCWPLQSIPAKGILTRCAATTE